MKYTKFVALLLEDDDHETGFITVAHHLRDEGILEEEMHNELAENLQWIEENLPKRPDFPQDQDDLSSPMSWLKESSINHLQKMRNIQRILEENDILVEIFEVDTPGKIIYEDDWQVVALPFVK
jgi:hypothetical protein